MASFGLFVDVYPCARAKNILNWFQMWAETVLGVFCLEILSELLSLHVEE